MPVLVGVGRRSSRLSQNSNIRSTGCARDEHESTGATGPSTSATVTETVSQPTSIHAGRPRCQLCWQLATAFEHRLAGLRMADWTGRPPGQRTGSMPSLALPPDMEGGAGRQRRGASQAAPPQRPAVKAPTRSAETGIQDNKLEEKECVIM